MSNLSLQDRTFLVQLYYEQEEIHGKILAYLLSFYWTQLGIG